MLKIKSISKTYKTGELIQVALDDVSLNLRENEFVSILGPSGSGKTTLLNIIGGLDRYDEGDLIINGVSTKNYKDRDWDTYRNHTIGFVFQSYNLIPHQNILSNVELALTIGGISSKERKQRALDALDKVGLKDQAHKKPNQLSGGQMQRVAIARALVNNPDILLADEPTGALDSKTSIQVMELLKEVAKDRLVVMVTHNPDLANQYSNRIVNLKDGKIISDSNPYIIENDVLQDKPNKTKKAHMSFLTALSLSFNNLLTKKGRTILTAFAGSIGIIGIALILSLSTGFQNYIDKIQEDALSSYPLTITSETADTTSAILSMVTDRKNNTAKGEELIERQYLTTMFSAIGTNDLKSLKKYLDNHYEDYKDDVTFINYNYSIKPIIYTIDATDKLSKLNPSSIISSMYSQSANNLMSSFSFGSNSIFSEMNENIESYKDQYEVLKGRWPEKYDELVIVLSEPNSISDLLIYSLGLRDTSELKTIMTNVMSGEPAGVNNDSLKLSYDDLLNIDLRLVIPTEVYKYNVKYDIYEDMSNDEQFMQDVYEKSLKLKVVGILCQKENSNSMALSTGVSYTKDLTKYIISACQNTAIVSKQLRNKNIDVFSGNSFDEENENTNQLDFNDMISVDEKMIQDAFKINISEDDFKFETVDQNKMQDIIMKAAKDASDAISKSPDATSLTAGLGLINASLLNYEIQEYEKQTVQENVLKIDEDKLQEFKQSINSSTYKTFVETFLNNDPQLAQYAPMIQVFTDEQYSLLSNGVASMFEEYYKQIKNNEEYNEENGIAYDNSIENNTRYGTSLFSSTLISQQLTTNQIALENTTNVVNNFVNNYTTAMIAAQIGIATSQMLEPMMESFSNLSDIFNEDAFSVDTDKFAKAFNFNMSEDELSRIMETMLSGSSEKSYNSNLINLGYQDIDDPSSISFYFKDFDSKENFLTFLDNYNESVDDDTKVRYTDITGILMSSVKTIVDVVTYVLIAFVSISLVVSSIMIAVITLISVLERTKEIGILRAMGASKRNVSSIFNAETFIIGLLSGGLGVGVTLALLPLINTIIHKLTDNHDVNAVLPSQGAIALVIIAVILTIIAGYIPSKKAAKQDPVIALRTE